MIKPGVERKLVDLHKIDYKRLKHSFNTGFFSDLNSKSLKPKRVQETNMYVVNKEYQEFYTHCKEFGGIDEFAKTTPFNRKQLYDFYTKFKSLSMLTIYNKDTRYVKKERKHLIHTRRTGGDTPKRTCIDKVNKFINDKLHARDIQDQIGIGRYEFKQGLKECRSYN